MVAEGICLVLLLMMMLMMIMVAVSMPIMVVVVGRRDESWGWARRIEVMMKVKSQEELVDRWFQWGGLRVYANEFRIQYLVFTLYYAKVPHFETKFICSHCRDYYDCAAAAYDDDDDNPKLPTNGPTQRIPLNPLTLSFFIPWWPGCFLWIQIWHVLWNKNSHSNELERRRWPQGFRI